MIRTSLIAISYFMVACSLEEGPCEYEETLLEPTAPTESGQAVGDEIAALEGPFAGTWRWNAGREELTIDGGGVEFPAQATFVPDLGTLRNIEHVGRHGPRRAFCGETGIRVNGMLTFTDDQGTTIVDIPILVERKDGSTPEYDAFPFYSPISEFSPRLHENFDYDRSGVSGLIQWMDSGIVAEFTWFGESTVSSQSAAGVFFEVAEFEPE